MLTADFDRLDLKSGDRVLDLGCGEGRHVHGLHMLHDVNVIGVDLDTPSIQKAREGLDSLPTSEGERNHLTAFSVCNALSLPFADDTFDAIICSEVLEHIHPYNEVLDEIRRVLKPGGHLCITVPRAWPERICWRLAPPPNGYPFENGGHVRIFDRLDLKMTVQNKGFAYHGKTFAHALHSPYWWLKCLFWNRQTEHPLVQAYHRLLVWDLMERPFMTRALEALLNPLMGKSVALYFTQETNA